MTEWIRWKQFHEASGTEDWRVLGEGACAYFRTGSFAAGARLVAAISEPAGTSGRALHEAVGSRYIQPRSHTGR